MFDKEYFDRVNLQQLASFFQFGTETYQPEEGSLEERHKRWSLKFLDAIAESRDAVLAEDWSQYPTENDKENRTEELFQEVNSARCVLESIALEAGLRTGLMLYREFFGEV